MLKLRRTVGQHIRQVILITISIFIIGVSINMFLAPHHIAAGGSTGIGVLVEFASGLDRAIVVFAINMVMLLLALIFLGRRIFANMVIGSFLVPIALNYIPEMLLIQDRLVSVLFGSAIFGVGVAILYKIDASSGGTTIPPLILKKYFNLNTSIGLLATDAIVVFFNIFVFGFDSFFFAILSLVVTSAVMNYIETGMKRKKIVLVNSKKLTEIQEAVLAEGYKKIRLFPTRDALRQIDDHTLMLLLDNSEYPSTLRLIDAIDHAALVITYNVAEVHGLDEYRKAD